MCRLFVYTHQKVHFNEQIFLSPITSLKRSLSRFKKVSTMGIWPFLLSLCNDVQSHHFLLYDRVTVKKAFKNWKLSRFHNPFFSRTPDNHLHKFVNLLLWNIFLFRRVQKVQNDRKIKRKNTHINGWKNVTWRKQSWSCQLSSCLCFGLPYLLSVTFFRDDFIRVNRKFCI